jgi:hypothetical protein
MDLSTNSLSSFSGSNNFSPPSGGPANSTGKLDANQKAQLIAGLKQQLMVAKLELMLETTSSKCFKMCVSKPSSSLSSSENVR